MGLKATVKSLDEVAEQFRSLYIQVGDEYALDVEEKDYKTKIAEFRDNNISMRKQLEEAVKKEEDLKQLQAQLQQFKDIDPEKAREALDRINKLEEEKLIDAGKIDELLAQRTERMRTDYTSKIEALEKALQNTSDQEKQLRSKLHSTVIDTSLQQAVSNVATVRKGAMQDILARGRGVWQLDDNGNPIPRGEDGKVLYGTDAAQPLTMEEWAQGLARDAGYLFEGNHGGGAGGGMDDTTVEGQVLASDQHALSTNLEAIAAGKVKVISQ